MPQELLISKVQMPEHGVFAVRVDETLLSSGAVSAGTTGRFIVSLDYGEDAGTVIETAPYDSTENEARAEKMRTAFLAEVQTAFPELRVPCARLSFGRRKLFLRYICEQQRPNLSAAQEALRRQFGVEVSLWAMGPRDEVAEKGGLGPCGRVCCCCSWQRRYPSHLAPDRRNALPALVNGTCGRFKCCLAFERGNVCYNTCP